MTDEQPSEALVDRIIAEMNPARAGADPKVLERMKVVFRTLHRALEELHVTDSELASVCEFLDEVGRRHEFLMLFDQLGISMHVNDITYAHQGQLTQNNVEGPFYRSGAPQIGNPGKLARDDEPGETLVVSGMVRDVRNGHAIPHAALEIWQTNSAGMYENLDPAQPDYNLRGQLSTDHDGKFEFQTIVPSGYPMGIATSVEKLLRLIGRDTMRPAHIHFKVAAAGYEPMTTQLYFADNPLNENDAIFSVKEPNLRRPMIVSDPASLAAKNIDRPFKSVEYDFGLFPVTVSA